MTDTVSTVTAAGGTIRTAVQSSANGIGKIHTMVKQGVRLSTAKDVGRVASNIGSGIRTGIAHTVSQTGTSLLRTKIDKTTVTDTGTEVIKQGLTDLRYADNARKAVQNTARGSIKAARAVKNMPRDSKAQIQRIRKNAQCAKKATKKSADAVKKLFSSKAGRVIALAGAAIYLVIFLIYGLLIIVASAIGSMFSWLYSDEDVTDQAIKQFIQTTVSEIQDAEADKQAEIDKQIKSLAPEYRYDGTQITGLNRFGNKTVKPYDDKAVLAVLAVLNFRKMQATNSTESEFKKEDMKKAVEMFYNFDYHYEYDYCPNWDCSKDSDCCFSLAANSFRISDTTYDPYSGMYALTMTGPTYTHASSMYTSLEIYMNDGEKITGHGWANVGGGTWSTTYNVSADAYSQIDWSNFYLTVDTVYCNNPNHKYLCGQVENLDQAGVFAQAGFTEDEQQLFKAYSEQIKTMGG